MAGDWIKMEHALPDKPEVWAIADELDLDPDAVVGKLFRVWVWFDQHTENGNAPSVTGKLLDRQVGVTGFLNSLIKVGWIVQDDTGLSVSNFERHNGQTSKKRALTNKRVKRLRNANDVTKALPEKRREEKSIYTAIFVRFWDQYPRKDNKQKAAEAFAKLNPDETLTNKILKNISLRLQSGDWSIDDKKHIPHASTYLNGARWEDEVISSASVPPEIVK